MTTRADTMARLTSNFGKMRALQSELDLSVKLADFEPRAFSHGKCKTRVVGNLLHSPQEATFVITLGNGDEIVYKMLDVPQELWGLLARQDYAQSRHSRRRSRRHPSTNIGE